MTASMVPRRAVADLLTPDEKVNLLICAIDNGGWGFGMAFFSTGTIVPALLGKLGAGNVLIGLLPALLALGYAVPGVFFANRVSNLPKARAWLFPVAMFERLPLLMMGFAVLLLPQHGILLAVLIAMYFVSSTLTGINQPAYWSVISKSIPELWRGRLFGISSLVGGIAGFAVMPIANRLLGAHGRDPLQGFAYCFIFGAAIMYASALPLVFVREPHSDMVSEIGRSGINKEYFRRIWRSSRAFRHFLYAEAMLTVSGIAGPFVVLDGIKRLHAGTSEVALYTAVGVIVGAFGGLASGYASDKFGNRMVLLIVGVFAMLSSLYALVAPSALLLSLVFALGALAGAGAGIAGPNIVMAFAESEMEVPHYMAFFNLVLAPIRTVALIAGGLISQDVNYATVFWISAIAAALSIVFLWRLKEPKRGEK